MMPTAVRGNARLEAAYESLRDALRAMEAATPESPYRDLQLDNAAEYAAEATAAIREYLAQEHGLRHERCSRCMMRHDAIDHCAYCDVEHGRGPYGLQLEVHREGAHSQAE